MPQPVATIGLLTDPHDADAEPQIGRYFRDSLAKLEQAVDLFKLRRVDRVIELGDLIDSSPTQRLNEQCVARMIERIRSVGVPYHCVLGNHCLTDLTKPRFAELTGTPATHEAFDLAGFHFVLLDANYRWDGQPYAKGNFQWTQCLIPDDQLDWLEHNLRATSGPSIVLSHQRLDPSDRYSVRNHEAVRAVLREAGNVVAVLQGHSHNNHIAEIDGIPYLVLRAMVEGPGLDNNSYAVLNLYADGSLQLEGFGQQASHTITPKRG